MTTPLIKYYTYIKDARAACQSGQTVHFIKGKGYWCFPVVVPVNPPGINWVVAAPGSTGEKITLIDHPNGAGVNVYEASQPIEWDDYSTIGGSDQAFLTQPNASGRTFKRCQALACTADGASIPHNNKHAFYVKSANVSVYDFLATPTKGITDGGLSVRYAGFKSQRISLMGGFMIPLCTFADDEVKGSVAWSQIEGEYTDTGVWLDCDEAAKNAYDHVLDNVWLTGPAPFGAVNTSVFEGTIEVNNCHWRPNPITPWVVVTASEFRGYTSRAAMSSRVAYTTLDPKQLIIH